MRLMLKHKNAAVLCGLSVSAFALAALAINFAHGAETRQHHALFVTSDRCIACHSNMFTADGTDVSIAYQWRASIMANSSRDPYWQAAIRREIQDHPQAKAAIEDTCSTCHMPMAHFQAHADDSAGEVARHLDIFHTARAQHTALPEATAQAMDGVSCTVCHQIKPDNFGQESSFDGGFLIDVTTPAEQRPLFGRFDVDSGRARAMHSVTGFEQTKAFHLGQAELCATCHTLYTRALDDQGRPAGVLPEQVPYQEWQHSAFAPMQRCQGCHMPQANGPTPISSVLPQPHPNINTHVFVGGNAFMLRILKDHREELGVLAPAAELEASALRTEALLATETAEISVDDLRQTGGRVQFTVTARNLAGHKLPTAYPARRAWLHVTLRDARGTVLFESGAPRPDGSVAGNDNDEDKGRFEPHYARITAPDQVQIYESIMGDFAGRVTTGLIYGSHYLKDNRLLPRGFDKVTAGEDIAVRGAALQDGDFTGGIDRVAFDVAAAGVGPLRVEAELLYQSIGFRWAQNLRGYAGMEPQRFLGYYEQHARDATKLLARTAVTQN
jgi:hypothetical protein